MADVAREPVPITAYDAPDETTLRVFFALPWSFITDVDLTEAEDGTITIALYRRVLRATRDDQIHEVDGAFAVTDSLRFDLTAPIADRQVNDANTARPIATAAGATKRGLLPAGLLETPAGQTPRWLLL